MQIKSGQGDCGIGNNNRSWSFETENFNPAIPAQNKGGKERDTNLKNKMRITKLVLFVCQSARSPEGKRATLSSWSSRPRILSRRGTISRPRSVSISSAHVKTKRVKTPTKPLKQEHPVVRTVHMATPCDTLICVGAPVLLAIVHPHIIPHIHINKINSLNTPDSPYSLHTSGQALWLLFSIPIHPCYLPKRMPLLSSAQ